MIVQNLSVPIDRRVWLECQALVAAGYRVSVICPRGPGERSTQTLDGVRIYRYPPPPPSRGAAGYAREFAYCWLATACLAVRIWRREPFDVIQACNPPDTYWALARLFRPRGVRFVFDHHDLNPELFRSRFGEPRTVRSRAQLRVLTWLERRTFRAADHIIATNSSYARIAADRGGRADGEVTVVRSGPDTGRMRPLLRPHPGVPIPAGRFVLAYLGIMGPQDGIDVLLRSLRCLVHDLGRTDTYAVLMGFGDSLAQMRSLAADLELDDYVTFTGRVDADTIAEVLSIAHVGLGPDPSSPLNDVSTMNKTMEYMAYALPVVTFDLPETRRSAGTAAVYAQPGDESGFAKAISDLLDDVEERIRIGVVARARAVVDLDWAAQRERYVQVFDQITGHRTSPAHGEPAETDRRRRTEQPVDAAGRLLVDLRGGSALVETIRQRSLV